MANKQLVWLITGTSTGFGRELVLNLLARGDKAIATARARSFDKLADLKEKGADTYELDVNASQDDLHAFAKKIIEKHGHVDVVVNNAGYMQTNTQEASAPEEVLQQFNTNVFAPMNINRAFLPYMRERKTGTIVWIGSIAGWRSNAVGSMYAATKHAVRALSLGLHQEILPFGLRSVCFEPGYFRTNFLGPENTTSGIPGTPAYTELLETFSTRFRAIDGKQPGDPVKAAQVMIDVVRGEGVAAGREFPPVLALGSDAYTIITGELDSARAKLDVWKDVTSSTDLEK
ncbi:NAD(P)-binding protein [Trametopsis cervina]|nr:NAD(P)-binding protein [Trametopsis cervina]